MGVLPTAVVRGLKRSAREAFPERLRKARRAAKLSALALAEKAGLGRGSVGMLEDAHRLPRVGTVARLSRVLGSSAGWLAFGDRRAAGEPDPEGLAARVRSAREALGITLHELGKLAASSYSQAQAMESGSDPSIEIIERYAAALGVAESWLAFGLGDCELPRRVASGAPETGSLREMSDPEQQ